MKNIMFRKGFVLGIILLFVGAGFYPALAVEIKSTIINNQVEEDCGCEEVDTKYHVVLDKQLNRLEVYSKLLLILFKDIPEVKEKCEEILDVINSNRQLDSNPIICVVLTLIYYSLDIILPIHNELIGILKNNSIIRGILIIPFLPFYFIHTYIEYAGIYYGCKYIPKP